MKARGSLLALALVLAGYASAGDILDTTRAAKRWYLDGQYLKAASEFEYLVTPGTTDPLPTANLALMYRNLGQPQISAAHWLKTTLLRSNDPFLWNQRAWNYLALSQFREARDAFKKAVENSTTSVHAAEAHFGLGLADSIDGNNKAALRSLQTAIRLGNPYIRAAADAELGRIYVAMRESSKSIAYLTSSLSHDGRQPELARTLGRVYEKTKQVKAAWQAYTFALDMSPNDPETLKRKKKMERYIPGNPKAALPLVKLARPMMRKPRKGAEFDRSGETLRVAMFSGPDGRPRHLTRFYVMGSNTTRLYDIKLDEEIRTIDNFTQWEVVYRPDNRVIEIRSNSGIVQYVTKQPFRFETVVPGHTILLKNPEVTDIRGIDLSDRELRGDVEVIPTPLGFHVVNRLSVDQYLFSVIGQALPRDELRAFRKIPREAYKAIAILQRSRTLGLMKNARPNPEKTHVCDSGHCLLYKGLTRERNRATQAVRDTRGMTVTLRPPTEFEHHLACGGTTAGGIQDRPVPKLTFRHPYDLEKFTHNYPDPEQFSKRSAGVPQIWNRWLRVLDAEELRKNLEKMRDVGPIRHVSVAKRDITGRVQALGVRGARGNATLEGAGQIRAFLSPGSLRSTLFTLQPIYRDKKLRRLLVWGAGTGHGRGLCVAGTLGRAHSGHLFTHILRHYFPGLLFKGVPLKTLAIPKPVPVPETVVKKKAKRRKPRKRRRPPSQ